VTAWSDLVATALVGTDRRAVDAGLTSGGDPAVAVLEEAATWSVYRRAGRLPVPGLAAPAVAPAESRPVLPPPSASRLAGLLDPADGDVHIRAMMLRALLAAAAERGLRVPPDSLPELLDACRRDRGLWALVAPVGGARLGWLAAQNPYWATLLDASTVDSDEASWHEGSLLRRAAYLSAARRSDPDAARALLQGEWTRLGHEERAALLGVLRTGLGAGDADLIESALGDRRREVRDVARDLARALPGSAFNARALARARACLVVGGDTIELALPTECDAGMRRDGIDPRPPKGEGERAWWFHQIMANAPVGDLTDLPPAEFLGRLSEVDGLAARARAGLAVAAIAHRDARWAAAILDHAATTERTDEGLLAVLPPDEQRRRLIDLLRSEPGPAATAAITGLLRRVPTPWADDLAAAVLELLAVRADAPAWPYDAVCAAAAFALPVRAAVEVARIAERVTQQLPDSPRLSQLGRAAAVLYQRHEMIKELT
jgi:hypothetical protein